MLGSVAPWGYSSGSGEVGSLVRKGFGQLGACCSAVGCSEYLPAQNSELQALPRCCDLCCLMPDPWWCAGEDRWPMLVLEVEGRPFRHADYEKNGGLEML